MSPAGWVDTGVVTAFLSGLQASGATVCLLHAGASPGSREWRGDIDLLVTSDRDAFLREMRGAAAPLGFSVVLQLPRVFNTLEVDLMFPGSTSWTVVFSDARGTVLHVDAVFSPGSVPGTAGGEPRFGVPQVDEETGFTYLVLKRLRKGDRDAEAWRKVADSGGGSARVLRGHLGDALVTRVEAALARGEAPDSDTVDRARRALRVRRARSPRMLRELARGARVAARRSSRPAGAFVSFGGVDGSGKSAVTDALVTWSPFRQVRHMHSRPGVLKPMGWFLGRKPSDGSEPHSVEASGPAMSAVRLVYYWADFAIGYWTRIWPVRARGGLVVSERWWWDMYVDPRRHRIRPMPGAARLLGRLVPRSDVCIVLDAPSSRIHERKQELSTAEIERQRSSWSEVASSIANLQVVDAAAPLPDVTDEVIQAVLERQRLRAGLHGGGSPRLVAFPRADPRWVVDPEDPDSMNAALLLYIPSRRRALAVARGAGALAKRTPLGGPVLRRLGGHPPREIEPALEWVREAAARTVPGASVRMTAYLGAPGPLKKLSALVLDDAGQPVLFAKVGTADLAVEALRHEAEVLGHVGPVARSVRLPQVLAFETDERGAMLLLSAVRGTRFHNRAPADERHLRLVGELLTLRRPVDGAAHRDALLAQLGRGPESPETTFLRAAVRATDSLWPALRSLHFAHGDLTPWNCLDCGAGLGVVDWEIAGYRTPGWDVLRYLVQIEAITRTGPVDRAAERILAAPFLARAGDLVGGAADLDLPAPERWEALKALVLVESAVELLATQPHLSSRGIAVRAHAAARILGMSPPAAET